MPKTGTTALQHFLSRNTQRLDEIGTVYSGYGGPNHSHNFLARLVHRENWVLVHRFISGLVEKEEKSKQFIISCGPLFAYSTIKAKRRLDDDLLNRFQETERAAIEGLIGIVSQYFQSIQVIAYLRRQDKVLESSYNQSIKNGTWHGSNISQFGKYFRNSLEYDRIADIWSGVVGKENLLLRVYDRQKLLRNDIRTDFIAQLGIPDSTLSYDQSCSVTDDNLRLSRDAFEYKAILNRIKMPRWRKILHKQLLREVDSDMGGNLTIWQEFLSLAERKTLLTDLKESNSRLAHEYFGMKAETPFDTSDIDCMEDNKYPGLTTEIAMEIHLRLTRKLNSPRYRYETITRSFCDWVRLKAPFLSPWTSLRQ